jgi:hypothetical protein
VHWTLTEVLSLDHAQRRRWVQEVAGQLEREGRGGGDGTWQAG